MTFPVEMVVDLSMTRKLAAILVTDVVDYSRLAGEPLRLRGVRGDLIEPAIAAHHGGSSSATATAFLIDCAA
jgi:adenylate cyclase